MNYQMIVTDLDGTLLKRGAILSNKTIQTIEKIKKENLTIVIASGRTYGEIVQLTEPLKLMDYKKAYFICYNGALTVRTRPFSVITKTMIHREDVISIIDAIGTQNYKYHIFTERTLYLSHDIEKSLEAYQPKTTKIVRLNMENYHQQEEVYKMLIYDEKEHLDYLKNNMPEVVKNNYGYVKSNDQLLEIFHKEGSKGNALKQLSFILGINKDQIIAFGDEENDISMLEYAGMGIAMGNAKNDVLAAAKHITLSNEFDGVAVALDKLLFFQKG
jgi:Cof subfamily protein (haloacid dehalogenase superfamily)